MTIPSDDRGVDFTDAGEDRSHGSLEDMAKPADARDAGLRENPARARSHGARAARRALMLGEVRKPRARKLFSRRP